MIVMSASPDRARDHSFSADIVSIGSRTRPDLLKAQADTWASPAAVLRVRNFWGFEELDGELDDGGLCASPKFRTKGTCASQFGDPSVAFFVKNWYGIVESGANRSRDKGWVCAQRRIGRAFEWLQSQYSSKTEPSEPLPDALLLVDDDTYLDVGRVASYIAMQEKAAGIAAVHPLAGAVCRIKDVGPFPFAYGGFGVFLNKEALRELVTPIKCQGDLASKACASLKANGIGERAVFKEGMSAFELFHEYTTQKEYCMHSDWLVGYMVDRYLYHNTPGSSKKSDNDDQVLVGMMTQPECGNITAMGRVHPCIDGAAACHRQTSKDMEALAIASYVSDKNGFEDVPKLGGTAMEDALRMVAEKEEAHTLVLPNVLLIGAQKAATTSVSQTD